jgi:hypothetical protein
MLVELSVVEQRYHAVLAVIRDGVPIVEVARRFDAVALVRVPASFGGAGISAETPDLPSRRFAVTSRGGPFRGRGSAGAKGRPRALLADRAVAFRIEEGSCCERSME